MNRYFTYIIILLCFSCKKEEGCMDPIAINYDSEATIENGECNYASIDININFTQTVNQEPVILNNIIYTNEANENYSLQTIRYLISDLTIHSDDTSVLLDDVHFVDISIPSSLTINIPGVIQRNYSHISFTMGLKASENITNSFLNEDFFPSFAWPEFLGGGYHYMQLEGDFNTVLQGYATHTGPTNGIDFSFTKNFPIPSISGESTITINMEINNWYSNPHTINLYDGIMENENIQALLQDNGETDVFSINVSK